MNTLSRAGLVALTIGCLALPIAMTTSGTALAQAKPAPAQAAPPQEQPTAIKQVALTDKQIEGVLAAGKDIDPIVDKLPENSKPDPKIIAQLEGIAKKNGFASYDEYNNVIDNIGLVFSGFDPATKKYVGNEAVLKAQIVQIQADKKMSPKDKKDALADLNDALKSPPPAIENKGNIDLVTKYYDKLAAAMGAGQQ
jgi:hypothetical protein